LVECHFKRDLQDGDLFVFINRWKTSAKLLHWDGTGMCIYAKRLARGRFTQLWETGKAAATVSLTRSELSLLMEGATCVEISASLGRKHATYTILAGLLG
jgi:transposase